MAFLRWAKRKFRVLLLLTVVGVLFYGESLCFDLKALYWPSFDSDISGPDNEVLKLLVVADPQLIGYQMERYGWLARFDSDRYLRAGYATVMNKLKPDAVIFLGDLFDEGSIATDEEFNLTYKRFESIFGLPEAVSFIYISTSCFFVSV